MRSPKERKSSETLYAFKALGYIWKSTVACVLLVDANGMPSIVPNPDFELTEVQRALRAFADGPWSGPKST